MTAQPIKGLGGEAIPACYVLAYQRVGNQCSPSMQCSQNTLVKEPAKAQKDRRERVETSLGP